MAEVKALACELPSEHGIPLSRWSSAELAREAIKRGIVATISAITIWRWLAEDAIRPWNYRSWIFPRDPNFAVKAGRILDLYEGRWEGQLLEPGDFVVCADQKPSIQARARIDPSEAAKPGGDGTQMCSTSEESTATNERRYPRPRQMTALSTNSIRASILIVCHRRVDMLGGCLESLERSLSGEVASERIVLFNGVPDANLELAGYALGGARVIVSPVNLGFGGGNNRAARQARGEYLVMLNDDTEVQPGWLESLVATADANADAGAVGSRILHSDQTLQEAGSLVWRDGSTLGVGRGLPESSRRYDYLREVDYASACSLLVRRDTFERLGGFDERYFPGYNEDVDLCLGIHRLRQRVLYQPRSVIVHHESQTGAQAKTFLILRGRRLLREKWGEQLERFAHPAPQDATAIDLAVHRARRSPRRLVIIDDRVPDPGAGSGFGRMLDAIRELAGAGYAISLYPTATASGERTELQDLGVEVVEGDLGTHLARPATFYDVAIVSRPHNFKTVARLRRHQPQCAIIYDAEALFHRRLEREAELMRTADPEAAQLALLKARNAYRLEQQIVRSVDRVISVSAVEAQIMRSILGHCPIEVLEPLCPEVRMTPRPFAERSGMVFVAGWLAPYPSPNSDGLEWFLDDVLPIVKARIPWARMSVTGRSPHVEVLRRAGPSLCFLGHVEDLKTMYNQARVAVVPVRYGAGIKIKALEALQNGVPVVTTTVGAEGISTGGDDAIAVCDDPEGFATRLVALLDDRAAWGAARAAIAQLHERWSAATRPSWSAIVETARTVKALGDHALHG